MGERYFSRHHQAVTPLSPWVARQADDPHVLLSAGKRISSRCERNQAAVVKRRREMGKNTHRNKEA